MIEELTQKYNDFKNVIEILPINTKYNRKRKIDYIDDEILHNNELLDVVKKEIKLRLAPLEELKVSDEVSKLNREMEKCNIINEWNPYNTAYEKMHLDYYLYQLHRYYKEDLVSVNACIKKIIESFKKVDIELTKEDFNFNNYASIYMDKILNNASDKELKDCFEEMYWKNSDIIKTIEINFKSIYLKNEKKIEKYYEARHDEFLKKHHDSEIYDMRINLNYKIRELTGKDSYLNFQKFVNNEYLVVDFNETSFQKRKDLYFSDNSYNYASLVELNQVLSEYNILIKYHYLLNDIKDKLTKRDSLKNSKLNALKEISKEEDKLKKINAKQNRKFFLFRKKKDSEKWLFEYKGVLNTIISIYDEFDNACFNDLVFTKLSQDSTVLEVLKLISSNYLYFVNKTYELDETQNISNITEKFEELRDYVNNNKFILLNNIALLDEKQMKQLIANKYNLENINLTIESLMEDNIDKTINDINMLINYENFISSGINIDDVMLYLDYNKLLNMNNSH